MNKSKLFTKKIPYYGHFDVDQLQASIREQDVILD